MNKLKKILDGTEKAVKETRDKLAFALKARANLGGEVVDMGKATQSMLDEFTSQLQELIKASAETSKPIVTATQHPLRRKAAPAETPEQKDLDVVGPDTRDTQQPKQKTKESAATPRETTEQARGYCHNLGKILARMESDHILHPKVVAVRRGTNNKLTLELCFRGRCSTHWFVR